MKPIHPYIYIQYTCIYIYLQHSQAQRSIFHLFHLFLLLLSVTCKEWQKQKWQFIYCLKQPLTWTRRAWRTRRRRTRRRRKIRPAGTTSPYQPCVIARLFFLKEGKQKKKSSGLWKTQKKKHTHTHK